MQKPPFCEPVPPPRDAAAFLRYFCAEDTSNKDALKENEPKRIALYKLTVGLIRAYADLANEMPEAGYTPQEIECIKQEVDYYENVRSEVKLASGDYIDLKMYEPAMRHLLDTYIRAAETKTLSAFDDMSLIQLVVERGAGALDALPAGIRNDREAVAETIENNLRKVITDEQPINPKYYEKMSELLDTLIQERKAKALEYEAYLTRFVALAGLVQNPAGSATYPRSLDTGAKRALYDNLKNDKSLALAVHNAVISVKKDSWRGNKTKEKEIWIAIHGWIKDKAEADRIFELVRNQDEY